MKRLYLVCFYKQTLAKGTNTALLLGPQNYSSLQVPISSSPASSISVFSEYILPLKAFASINNVEVLFFNGLSTFYLHFIQEI